MAQFSVIIQKSPWCEPKSENLDGFFNVGLGYFNLKFYYTRILTEVLSISKMHDCAIFLIDRKWYPEKSNIKYIPTNLVGPSWTLLSRNFFQLRRKAKVRLS